MLVACGGSKRDHGQPDASSDAAPDDGGQCDVPAAVVVTIGTGSRWDVGWTGFGHGLDFPAGAEFALAIERCDPDCQTCDLVGPILNEWGSNNRRCTTDTSVTCSSASDCPKGGTGTLPPACAYLAGPPFSFGDNTCVLIEFAPRQDDAPPIRGKIDLKTGALSVDVNVSVRQSLTGACARCEPVGTEDPSDGGTDAGPATDGGGGESVCSGGLRGGQACEVHGYLGEKAYSYDCPPADLPTSHTDIDVGRVSSVGELWSLDASRPNCSRVGNTADRCWCGLCDSLPLRGCTSDRDCGGANGKCGKGPEGLTGPPTAPNGCSGRCDDGECEDEHGNPEDLSCFPGTPGSVMRAPGVSSRLGEDRYEATLGGLTCVPPTANSLLDTVFGLPGPVRMQLNVTLRTPK
ncbi:MAG: hypothetical protein R3A78_09275 [Polyangiales bacterium]|nr:hypothetical protein [Myxococcales bacterium]